jgi:crotonobetainyl-CoA:carnitine CoA-transferase CaiB-like acyl-CoA transferase
LSRATDRTYRCADGGHVAVGAIEPAFRQALLRKLGLLSDNRFLSGDIADDAYCTQKLADIFGSQPRHHWEVFFTNAGACVTPVLSIDEANGTRPPARGIPTCPSTGSRNTRRCHASAVFVVR